MQGNEEWAGDDTRASCNRTSEWDLAQTATRCSRNTLHDGVEALYVQAGHCTISERETVGELDGIKGGHLQERCMEQRPGRWLLEQSQRLVCRFGEFLFGLGNGVGLHGECVNTLHLRFDLQKNV
jgi:hypothetical protein